jgi:hypothetical protein
MASAVRPLSRMVARSQTSQLLSRQSPLLRATTSQFHTSSALTATPYGQPPKGFRLPRPKRFDEEESSLDKASNYFLLTELFRGMYVVLEQFFRPPYVHYTYAPHNPSETDMGADIQSTTPSKKVPSPPASVANTPCAATLPAKNAASHASYAKLSAPPRRSRLKLKSEKMGPEGRRDMIST